jgi:hypothetical protein
MTNERPVMWRRLTILAKRYRRKWKQVPFHDRLNIVVASGSFFLGVMAIVLTVVALRMAKKQEAIAVRQSEIAERQFAFQYRQLERDADVHLLLVPEKGQRFNVLLHNLSLVDVHVEFVEVAIRVKQVDCKRPGQTQSDRPIELRYQRGPEQRRERKYFDAYDFTVVKESDYVVWECTSPEIPKTAWDLHEMTAEWNVRTRDRLLTSPKPMMGDSHFDPAEK